MIQTIEITNIASDKKFAIRAWVEDGVAIHRMLTSNPLTGEFIASHGVYSTTHIASGCSIGHPMEHDKAMELFKRELSLGLGQMSACEITENALKIAYDLGVIETPDNKRAVLRSAAIASEKLCKVEELLRLRNHDL